MKAQNAMKIIPRKQPRRVIKASKEDFGGMMARVAGEVPHALASEVRTLIEDSRRRVARVINEEMTELFWQIGERIRVHVLKEQRAGYGEQIVSALSRQLTEEFGRGFSEKSLRHMIRFAEIYPDHEKVSALRRQLSWSHIKTILYIEEPLKRDFYAELSRIENWSLRTLSRQIDGMLFERTAISRKSDKVIAHQLRDLKEEDRLTPELVFRDPYFLDFLGLPAHYSEADLEAAILAELEKFILELGTDFAFVARQKRITIDHEDYHLDLLFYHRRMRRLVAIDLKLGKFQAGDKGQMELYLQWLAQHEQRSGEESPIGLILCSNKGDEHIKLLRLEESGIKVAEYMTQLPPKQVLEQKFHLSIQLARQRLEDNS